MYIKLHGLGSHNGFTDLYDSVRNDILNAINSGKDFETDWIDSKNQCGSWKLQRIDGIYYIDAYQSMDEGFDLVDDAYNDVFGECCEWSDNDICAVLDEWANESEYYGSEYSEGVELPEKDYTLDEILTNVDDLMDNISSVLEKCYESMKKIVKNFKPKAYSADKIFQKIMEAVAEIDGVDCVESFRERHLCTHNKGFVVTTSAGEEIHLEWLGSWE